MQENYDRLLFQIGPFSFCIWKRALFTLLIMFLYFLGIGSANSEVQKNTEAQRLCSSVELQSHVRFLSSDALKGRAPGTAGGEAAALYIANHFREIGLQPGPYGYLQPVPFQALRSDPKNTIIRFTGSAGAKEINLSDAMSVSSDLPLEKVRLSAPLVFAGYGIDAPKQGLNHYGSMDVRGKIVLIFDGLPKNVSPDLSQTWRSLFSRKDYKILTARSRGAAGILIVGQSENNSMKERIIPTWHSGHRLSVIGDLTPALASELLGLAQVSFEELQTSAGSENFQPRDLGLTASIELVQFIRTFASPNVVGVLQGGTQEAVLFLAHYDGLGSIDQSTEEDKIFNGAHDNASGVAALLCLAKALRSQPEQFRRTAVFLATTAEETGKYGAEFYTMQPAIPLPETVLAINIDGLNIMGKAKDYIALGVSQTNQSEIVTEVMAQNGLIHRIDARLEDGMLFGFDTMFLFSRGLPAFTLWAGVEYPDLSDDETKQAFQRLRSRYHTTTDEVDSNWKWDGSMQHLEILESLARFYLASSIKPVMNRNSVFDALDPYVPHLMTSLPSVQNLLLPFKTSTSHRLVQGWNGPYGHRDAAFYSYDFLADIGTEVLSARDGRVAFVEERFVDGNRIPGNENVIVIDHGDGTFSRYYHLTHDGSKVVTGDRVKAGQVIGLSGDTGASAGPHLHFDVTVGCFQWGCQTVPIEFSNAIQNPLISGRDYTALP